MATKLSMYERERFKYGDAAGDGKGDQLRIHAIKAEQSNTIVYDWLSGGKSEVRLPNALPVERGGTGGTTAQSGRLNLGLVVNTNNEVMFGSKVISVYNGAVLDHDGTVKPGFIKNGVGDYRINGPLGFALNGFKYCLPKDEIGNTLCGCAITFDSTGFTLKVHPLKYLNGVASVDTTKLIDLPTGRCIDVSTK